ncbi:MAG: LamG domain-containing protein [Kiritimatiellae bacterium]|nr:LamG domain-containing protein [Kiritimatiellia bacterium]
MKTLKSTILALAMIFFAGGLGAVMTDELGLAPLYWYKNVSGLRSYGTSTLTWDKQFTNFLDTDEGSLCAASVKGGCYGSGVDYGKGDWTLVGRFRSIDLDNVPVSCRGSPCNTKSSATIALASGGAGIITLSGCSGNSKHADFVTVTIPDASTTFHSYAIQRLGQKVSLWVDGEKRGELDRPNNPNQSYFQFGAPYGGVGNTGYVASPSESSLAVADFRFYQVALTADDLKTLAYPPRDEIGERPYVWFPFAGSLVQAGASTAAIDMTGESVIFGTGRCGVKRTAIQAGGGIPSGLGTPWGTAGTPWTVLISAKSENADHAVIYSTGDGSANSRFALVSGGTDKVILAGFSGAGGTHADLVTATVPDATTAFHLYAIQRNGNMVSLWVDGVKIGEVSRPDNPTHNASSFFSPLGQMGGLRVAASAVVDDFRVYRKSLTAEQMTAILNAQRDELGETPVHWLPLNGDLTSLGKCEPLWTGGTANVAFGPGEATDKTYFVSSGEKPTGTNVAWRSRNWTVVVKARSTDVDNAVIASFGASRSTASSSMALTSCGPGKIALSGFSGTSAHGDLILADVPDASTAFHSYAIRRSDLTVSLWIDGVEIGTISRPSNPTFNGFGLGTIFDGLGKTGLVEANDVAIDDVRVYEQALSPLELIVLSGQELVATASWTGAGGDGSPFNPANWACTNQQGQAIANAVPNAFTDVTLPGVVNLQVPETTPVAYDSLTFACSLGDDVDWSGLGPSTKIGTVDLATHALAVRQLEGNLTVTDTVGNGQFRIDVPAGTTYENKTVALAGGVKLVKLGAGEFIAKREGQSYAGGTEVAAGTLKFGMNGDLQPLGGAGGTIDVKAQGVLDLNGFVNQYLNPLVLEGGVWANTGAAQSITSSSIASLTLTDDSQINVVGSISLAAEGLGPSSLDLGGHVLTVNVANNLVFRLMNCTATNGTVRVVGANANSCLSFNATACRAETVDFDLSCSLAPYVATTVRNLTLRSASVYQDVTPGVTSVLGTFKTYTKKFQNIELRHGSTLDLTEWEGPFNTASELQDRAVTFAPGATVTVDVHGHELVPGQQLVSWAARPERTTFRLDSESALKHGVVVQRDGLYVAVGLLILVR